MAAIFVTYADREFREAAARLRRRARKMGLFDKVYVYTPKQLPDYILSSPLYKYSRGGGYWCWKPYILHDALSKCEMGDVVYYAENIYDATSGADAILVLTEWMQFRMPDWGRLKSVMKQPVVVDGRNLYLPEEMKQQGFDYLSIGR